MDYHDAYIKIMSIYVGLCMGSFINLCAYRIPRGESISNRRSHCNNCGTTLTFIDLIPVISYILLSGRCRKCKVSYGCNHILVELFTMLLTFSLFLLINNLILAILMTSISYLILYKFIVSMSKHKTTK